MRGLELASQATKLCCHNGPSHYKRGMSAYHGTARYEITSSGTSFYWSTYRFARSV
ncbi:hypothetical protein SK128_011662 [Halocaridina rubra]|uniref:Uncharacterized protein n=1 Tax=Halocaridina rubra TaxID=373956 RepID=A0AAN8WPJ3_HALRR